MRVLLGVVGLLAIAAAPAAAVVHQGTPARDSFVGTPGADVVLLFGGPDSAKGRGGDDVIFGGDGRDALAGGAGGDLILAGRGSDEVWPDKGADVVHAGDGADFVNVAPDGVIDRIRCDRGHDVVVLMPKLDPLDEFVSCEEFWEFVISPR